MRIQPLGTRKFDRRRTKRAQLLHTELQDGGSLHKSSTERPDENRAERAVGQYMVGAADIVADHLGRITAKEHRPGVAHRRQESLPDRRSRSPHARPRCG